MGSHGVIKFKPGHSPRTLDERAVRNQERAEKMVHASESAVRRSRALVKESKKVMAEIRRRRDFK